MLSRALTLAAVAAAAIGGSAALAAPAVAEEPWGFEQVTPSGKGEGAVNTNPSMGKPSPDGNTLLYGTRSSFAAVPAESTPNMTRYIARRGPDGWNSKGTDPPNKVPAWIYSTGTQASSTNLAYAVVTSRRALTPGATEDGGNIYIRDTATGALTLIATSPDHMLSYGFEMHPGSNAVAYVADDGKSALFQAGVELSEPGGEAVTGGLFKWTADEGLRLVSVLPRSEGGRAIAASTVGATPNGPREPFPAGPGALDHIYFQPWGGGLYVRSGNVTRAVSISRLGGASTTPVPARHAAVSDGGRHVFFTADAWAPLTEEAEAARTSQWVEPLYRYDIVDDVLEYIGFADPYQPVINISRDGQTVAFAGVAANTSEAIDGYNNIYVWRRGRVRFVHAIEPDAIGFNLPAIPRLLSPNGRYLAFTMNSESAARRVGVVPSGPSCSSIWGDPAPCLQVYRFDADAPTDEEGFSCASCQRDGRAPQGHAGDPESVLTALGGDNTYDRHQAQTVADDGTVFFATLEALVPEDRNGQPDAYALRNGRHQLLSRARIGTTSRFYDATPDGRTAFITTNDQLVETDADHAYDIYMTRAGAGYAPSGERPLPPCEATCRGVPAADGGAQPLPALASISFVGSGNAASGPVQVRPRVSKVRPVRGSAGKVTIKVAGRGSLWLSGRGLVPVSRRVAKAGTFKLTVRLTPAGRRALRKRRSVRRTATVSFVPAAGEVSSTTVSLTFKAPKAAKKKGRR